MNYQWYPGHMTKAKRMMQENIKLIDLVIELVDARVPLSSRNPDIDELAKNKSRILLLNKFDLADAEYNKKWSSYFKEKGMHVVEIDSRNKTGMKNIQRVVQDACKEKMERNKRRGIVNRPVRAMVVGIPNVGKSTFINSFAGKACTKTGNKPGVTKGKQWIRLNKGLELLDTPGILWPKFEEQAVGMRLAFIGSMNDDILNTEELALELIHFLEKNYPGALAGRYGEEIFGQECGRTEHIPGILKGICISRRCYLKGEELDMSRAASIVLDDFRNGKLGRITLEFPDEVQSNS